MEPVLLTLLIVVLVATVVVVWISGPKDMEKEKGTLEGVLMCVAGLGLLVLFVQRRKVDKTLPPALFFAGIFFCLLLVLGGAYVIISTRVNDLKISLPKPTQNIIASALAVVPAALLASTRVNWGYWDQQPVPLDQQLLTLINLTKTSVINYALRYKSNVDNLDLTELNNDVREMNLPQPLFKNMTGIQVKLILHLIGVFYDINFGAVNDEYHSLNRRMEEPKGKFFAEIIPQIFSYFTGEDLYLWSFPMYKTNDLDTGANTASINEYFVIKVPLSQNMLTEFEIASTTADSLAEWMQKMYVQLQQKNVVQHELFGPVYRQLLLENRGKIIGEFRKSDHQLQLSRAGGTCYLLNYEINKFVQFETIMMEYDLGFLEWNPTITPNVGTLVANLKSSKEVQPTEAVTEGPEVEGEGGTAGAVKPTEAAVEVEGPAAAEEGVTTEAAGPTEPAEEVTKEG